MIIEMKGNRSAGIKGFRAHTHKYDEWEEIRSCGWVWGLLSWQRGQLYERNSGGNGGGDNGSGKNAGRKVVRWDKMLGGLFSHRKKSTSPCNNSNSRTYEVGFEQVRMNKSANKTVANNFYIKISVLTDRKIVVMEKIPKEMYLTLRFPYEGR